MGTFQTYQTIQRYEDALQRHAQWVRWVSGIVCPCLTPETGQPDPHCPTCKGRGKIYTSPGKLRLLNDLVKHDENGRVYPKKTPIVVGSATVCRAGVPLPLASVQPADGSYVQLANFPYPKVYEILTMDCDYDPDISVVAENSTVYGTNVLRVIAPLFSDKGKQFEGSIKTVTRVRNVTRSLTYTVVSSFKVYIHLLAMPSWVSGDILEVDYVYQKPFEFMLTGISPKMRYNQPYVLEQADATLVTPYWAQVAPDDLFTTMAVEQTGRAVLQPTLTAGNDIISAYYDLSRLLRVIDATGREYSTGVGKDVELYGRNELKWNITKPAVALTAQFTYHPTYIALEQMHTLRNSENKAFVNRIGVRQFDHVHEKVEY